MARQGRSYELSKKSEEVNSLCIRVVIYVGLSQTGEWLNGLVVWKSIKWKPVESCSSWMDSRMVSNQVFQSSL